MRAFKLSVCLVVCSLALSFAASADTVEIASSDRVKKDIAKIYCTEGAPGSSSWFKSKSESFIKACTDSLMKSLTLPEKVTCNIVRKKDKKGSMTSETESADCKPE